MAQNVEIKARLRDRPFVEAALNHMNAGGPTELHQVDVFFPTSVGRLKLRTINGRVGEVIFYDRPDVSGPKTSDYVVAPTADPAALRAALSRAYGERAMVEKHRTLYLVGDTRVHLDRVAGLGDFLELEVVLPDDDAAEAGRRTADELMRTLGIDAADLVTGAYVDQISPPVSDETRRP